MSLPFEGGLAESTISGPSCVLYLDSQGGWAMPYADPFLWFPIGGLLLLQSLIVFGLIRLRPVLPPFGLRL